MSGSTASLEGVRFLLPPGHVAVSSCGGAATVKADDIEALLDATALSVGGVHYPRPAADAEVDLRDAGIVRIGGKAVNALE
ncbi:hypothetical protein EBB59_01095 [Lysobacter pythonis]|uniref:Uncharacterized protein n=1 Tax=Solilutibacter pythonis TaxID=2483112 RepID=A0A3M2HYV8_9GAMM|nr:hypothetical protein [Lysobacter pythonis]RMH94916.1 hypothetical protein EBB59_01095 [Lysobacter pythonis]